VTAFISRTSPFASALAKCSRLIGFEGLRRLLGCLGVGVVTHDHRRVASVLFQDDEQPLDPLAFIDYVLPFPVKVDGPGGPVHEPGMADDPRSKLCHHCDQFATALFCRKPLQLPPRKAKLSGWRES
jgi:hypothetical protein